MTVSSFHGVIILLCAIWTNICALPLENKDTVCRDCLGFFYRKSKSVFTLGNIIGVNECFTDYPYIGFNRPRKKDQASTNSLSLWIQVTEMRCQHKLSSLSPYRNVVPLIPVCSICRFRFKDLNICGIMIRCFSCLFLPNFILYSNFV